MMNELEQEWQLADDGFTAGVDFKNWLGKQVSALRARVAEAEARAQQAEAENGRLREALQLANRILYEHHNAAYKLDWGMVCQIRKESGVFETIDAALAASAPETGEREAESAVVVSVRDAAGYYTPIVSADTDELAHEFLAAFYKEQMQNDLWTTDDVTTYVPHLRAKALRARASVAGGGEGEG